MARHEYARRNIKARHLTQAQAGEMPGIERPQVSLLLRNRSGSFSVERLMEFLTALGHDGELHVRRTRRPYGQSVLRRDEVQPVRGGQVQRIAGERRR